MQDVLDAADQDVLDAADALMDMYGSGPITAMLTRPIGHQIFSPHLVIIWGKSSMPSIYTVTKELNNKMTAALVKPSQNTISLPTDVLFWTRHGGILNCIDIQRSEAWLSNSNAMCLHGRIVISGKIIKKYYNSLIIYNAENFKFECYAWLFNLDGLIRAITDNMESLPVQIL
jgi:hypothetical protein